MEKLCSRIGSFPERKEYPLSFFSWNNNNMTVESKFLFKSCIFMVNMNLNITILQFIYIISRFFLVFAIVKLQFSP